MNVLFLSLSLSLCARDYSYSLYVKSLDDSTVIGLSCVDRRLSCCVSALVFAQLRTLCFFLFFLSLLSICATVTPDLNPCDTHAQLIVENVKFKWVCVVEMMTSLRCSERKVTFANFTYLFTFEFEQVLEPTRDEDYETSDDTSGE